MMFMPQRFVCHTKSQCDRLSCFVQRFLNRSLCIALSVLVVTPVSAANQNNEPDLRTSGTPKGFSYFAVGLERVNYSESITIGGAKLETDTTTENIVLLSGGRTFVNRAFSFSINATSTLYPNRVTESWHLKNSYIGPDDLDGDGSADIGASKTYGPQTIQTNSFTYTQAATQILLHYHPDLWWSIDGGLTYSLGTFKRFSFNYKAGVLVCDQGTSEVKKDCSGNTVVEETFAELSAHGGGSLVVPIYEGFRFRLATQLGVPLVSRIENTQHPDLIFDSSSGWQAELTSSLVYHFNENINLGLLYDFQYQFKDRQGKRSSDTGNLVYIPENVRMAHRYGIVISWAF